MSMQCAVGLPQCGKVANTLPAPSSMTLPAESTLAETYLSVSWDTKCAIVLKGTGISEAVSQLAAAQLDRSDCGLG